MHASRTTADRRSRTQTWKQGSKVHRCEPTKSTYVNAPPKIHERISFNCNQPIMQHSCYVTLTLSSPIPLRLDTLPYWSNPPFLMFDIRALWHSGLSTRAPECQTLTSSSAMAERPHELGDFKKARVNGGTNNHSLKGLHKCLRCR